MPNWAQLLWRYFPLVIAGGSCGYFLGVIVASLRFRREADPSPDFTPPVSVLKPCAGIEPHFYETLRSHFVQNYPQFELIFCLRDESDAALWTIQMLQKEFPAVSSRVIFTPDLPDTNSKTVKLRALADAAQFDVLVISDGDIRVPADYLRRVVAPLRNEQVGLVTCLYRGLPARGLNSLLEALSMSGDFVGQVLLGRMASGMRFGLGATLATRKKQLAAIGGLTPWLAYLADDFILGNKIAGAGYKVHLSRLMVETQLPARGWAASFRQQLRWARTIRACSPGGYPGLIFAYGLPIALLGFCSFTTGWPLMLLLATLVLRLLAGIISGWAVAGDPLVSRFFWLLPVRDLWALLIWIYSFCGNRIVWRNQAYRLSAGGKLTRI